MRFQSLLLAALCSIASAAQADLAGTVYRIAYQNAGVEDCLRFATAGSFVADSSLMLPAGIWAQRGPAYTAHQNDANGNTFTWGGAELAANGRLIGAFVSSLGLRLGFSGLEDPECEVSFDELSPHLGGPGSAAQGEQIYALRAPDGETLDCLRLSADGVFAADTLTALGFPPGAWHRSGVALAAYQSGDQGEAFSVNSWGGLALAGGTLWFGVDSGGERLIARATRSCVLGP